MSWEMVIGLETHVELNTKSKVFCTCETAFGAEPNTHVCPVCMGLPGALPVFNEAVLNRAAMAGFALNCHVHHRSRFDRKNYVYPDLPKAYQISQFYRPICEGGWLTVQTAEGEKKIGITRIHIEEDAGKLVHDEENGTMLDMNRCGVPLIEIVSEPDIRSAEEAVGYLRKIRAILTYIGVSDCRMNEGSLRCDVNLSIHKPGEPFGVRTEMKNLNSFQSVERAIQAEFDRQVAAVEAGEEIVQETRRYDQKTGKTSTMRRKENSADYRYFPDPDLPEVRLTDNDMAAIVAAIPTLPDARREAYMRDYGLTAYAAEQLTVERWMAEYFEEAAALAQSPVGVANLLQGEVFALIGARAAEAEKNGLPAVEGRESLPVAPQNLAKLADLLSDGRVNSSTGKKILAALFCEDCDPEGYAAAHELFTVSDDEALLSAARRAMAESPDMVLSFQKGKLNVEKALMGKAMAIMRGKANPERLAELLHRELTR
ncbi:MAG TPA: Asp-tRNA(Asn)/Glu-tRNA(Gln) amidotransferase subunit GatB [Candidatus Limiplasma sp.]|nr:Asp-tRNA(Asn)/Glu-tRNA(Gln) amidotransferase subunit GatB [Candidatus Limiplasma sp.]HPS81153.1 Asp-tRNA(Asn)/Glu-tRNA(Gln) amidotransferase subunit GatB [Candidatus Limiplasma sp.]